MDTASPGSTLATSAGAEDGAAVLRCTGLKRAFGKLQAVDDVSFAIQPGETYGLLGPNGAGKTTTISMICGLLEPDAGTIEVMGQSVSTRSVRAREDIGYVPQDLAIYGDLSARENLRFFGRMYGMTGAALTRRVDEVLEVTALADRANDRAEEFSGGMQRRLNIGIGLLHGPKLLVLDEPTVGVDPQSRAAILDNVATLSSEGMAVLYTTHYMEEAERLCDRVGIVDKGRMQAEGTRAELVRLVGEHDRVTIEGGGATAVAAKAAGELPAVVRAVGSDGGVELLVDNAGANLLDLLRVLSTSGMHITGVEVHEPNLEAVFLHLTGRALRD